MLLSQIIPSVRVYKCMYTSPLTTFTFNASVNLLCDFIQHRLCGMHWIVVLSSTFNIITTYKQFWGCCMCGCLSVAFKASFNVLQQHQSCFNLIMRCCVVQIRFICLLRIANAMQDIFDGCDTSAASRILEFWPYLLVYSLWNAEDCENHAVHHHPFGGQRESCMWAQMKTISVTNKELWCLQSLVCPIK